MNIKENLIFSDKELIELNSSYIYNFYREDEAIQDDSEISLDFDNATKNNASYIYIELELNNTYTTTAGSELLHQGKIDELNTYKRLPVHIDKLFHTPRHINKSRAYITSDIDFKDFLDYYNVYKDPDDLKNINLTKKMTLSTSFLDRFVTSNRKSSFHSSRDENIFTQYESLFDEFETQTNLDITLNNGKFLGDYKPYNKINVNVVPDNLYVLPNEKHLECCVGFYIVKFLKISGSDYEKISSRFVKLNENIVVNENSGSYQVIKDRHVKYGRVYKYMIYPVHSLTIQSYENNFTYDQILLCDYPLFTEDISTEETVSPNYPAGPFVKINRKNMSLEISWEKSYEKQGDIKGFQVLKRFNLDEPFTVIQELRSHLDTDYFIETRNINEEVIDSTPGKLKYEFTDLEFDPSKVNIYAVCSIDAHGQISNYSTQIGVVYDILLDKTNIDVISLGGAPYEFPNLLIPRKTTYFDNEESIITNTPVFKRKDKFTVYFTPDAKNICGSEIRTSDNKIELLNQNSSFSLSIFRLNGQKNITINNNEPLIKIENFS